MVHQGYGGSNNPNLSSGDQNRKIFLGGLSYHTTDETLRAFCSRFGKMTDCLVMRNAEGKSRGFGFVTYEDTSSVEDFMRSRPHTIDNRQIDPKRAMPREEQNSTEAHLTVKKLFVAGLREGINEDSLRQYFSRFGNIVEVLVMKDRDGKPRGFAFVTFDDYDAVDKAVLEKPHIINGRNLDVKKAVPKEKMQEESGNNAGSGTGGADMSPFNRQSSSNYSGPNTASPSSNQSRNNFGSMRDNYNGGNGNWDNQNTMSRMNNPNPNYNQPPTGPYGQQGGYNSNTSGFNPSMTSASGYSQPFNQMGQSQPPPPLPPPLPPSQPSSMMNYDMYNNNSNMPFNMNPNQPSASNYMQSSPSSYGQNQQQNYGNNPNNFGNMNNPFNLPPPPPPSTSGNSSYNNLSSGSTPYDNSSSYGITSQNYGGGNYNNMPPQQQSRGGGPMRGGRGSGNSGNYGGNSSGDSGYGNRPAPYPSRGGRGGGGGGGRGGRGRGRGQ